MERTSISAPPLNVPEHSNVCVATPSGTFSDRLAGAKPKNLIMVLTASCNVLTADNEKVSSASTHSTKNMIIIIVFP